MDNRFDTYRWRAEYAARPWRIIPAELAAVPGYLDVGNSRPLGRMLERGLVREFGRQAPAYGWRVREALQVTMQQRHGFDYCVPDEKPPRSVAPPIS